ncbi:hypothetical protein BGZ63DRAFT_366516 [Mariannaea sp. PMI_226]|nr:hypothetical protein BGZ63DRAFT_366516 [Mariannaea sp. PMI_226]
MAKLLDPKAITFLENPFELVPVIRNILASHYCAPDTVFLVEGVDNIPVSKSGRWQAVRLLLGDGELCIQALLAGNMHRPVATGEVAVGSYVRCKEFQVKRRQAKNGSVVAYLVVDELFTVGWNESYRVAATATAARKHPAAKKTHQENANKNNDTNNSNNNKKEESPEITDEDAFEAFETMVHPKARQPSPPPPPPPKNHQQARSELPMVVALARDWHDMQTPLKLTTLRSVAHLPYAQNWSCNVLAIVASLSPVEPSNLAPHKQRTARLADPSTSKQIHLTVFLDPDDFEPRVGSAVLLVGVKNHRFDGGSLKKYASDRHRHSGRWWFQDPVELTWCDVQATDCFPHQLDNRFLCKLFFLSFSLLFFMVMEFNQPSGVDSSKRAEIDEFITSLSPWDLIYVRHRLRNIKIELSGLEHLPEEIVCMLIRHLRVQDFLACRLVSRGWAASWSQDLVVAQACRRFFPGVLETSTIAVAATATSAPELSKKAVLFRAIHMQQQDYRRIYFKRDAIHWNAGWDSPEFVNVLPRPQFVPDGSSSTRSRLRATARLQYPVRYANGKVGWQPLRDLIIVDNLNTRSRQRVVCPRLEAPWRCQLARLSDQLVVIFGVNGRNSHVYHLQHCQFKTIHLPSPVGRCFVQDDRVGAVTVNGQVIIWSWDGKATQLKLENVSHPPDTLQDLRPGILLDPFNPRVVFVVWCHQHPQSDRRLCTFQVIKFEDARQVWQSSAFIANPLEKLVHECNAATSRIQLSFSLEKADSHGSFTLAAYRLEGQQFISHEMGNNCHGSWRSGDLGAISFNVITQTFTQNYYAWRGGNLYWNLNDEFNRRAVGPHNLLESVTIWNNRLMLLWSHQLSGDEKLKSYLLVVNPVDSSSSASSSSSSSAPIMYYPLNVDGRTSAFVGPVIQDDGRVLVPTERRLWLLEPVEQRPEDGSWDFIMEDANDDLPEYFHGKSHILMVLNHSGRNESVHV